MPRSLFQNSAVAVARPALATLIVCVAILPITAGKFLVSLADRLDAGPDLDLINLAKDLVAAKAEMQRLERAPDAEFNAAVDRGLEIANRIYLTPARTPAGLRLKAETFAWLQGDEVGWGVDGQGPTDHKFAHALARDLLATRPSNRRAIAVSTFE